MKPHSIHVFLGPTLSHTKAAGIVTANFQPPAAMGDITKAVSNGAEAIVLVDGVFERGPSVWHKEILWALSCGIPVIGCASMGALRAAELDGHGMLGVGEVYNSYSSGHLIKDDEVAVMHAPQELNWECLTDAMVDIRHRIAQAERANILSPELARNILKVAEKRFFKDRVLASIVEDVVEDKCSVSTILTWLARNTTGIKRQDCMKLLQSLPATIVKAMQRLQSSPPFHPTIYLRRLEKFGFNVQH